MIAELAGPFYPVVLVYLDWPTGPKRVHSSVGTITFDGHSWEGVGHFGQIDVPMESAGMSAPVTELKLVAVPIDSFTFMDDTIRNLDAEIYVGCLTARSGNTLAAPAVSMFVGYMDALRSKVERQGDRLMQDITLSIASGPGARTRSSVEHSYEDQIINFPGDTAGRHLLQIEAQSGAMTWPET
jgi:hypothetical protein